MKLSVVTTLYNSAPYITEFVRRISLAAEKITSEYEIIMVDDGSPDRSLETALNELKKNKPIRIVELSRNFGHHKAMMTGLEEAKGEFVFLIDVDLEEPPELLAEFYSQLLAQDVDVIFGIQKERQGSLVKRIGGKLGWWLITSLISIKIPPNQCTVRLMRHDYVRQLLRYKEQMTAIGGLWVLTGYKQRSITIDKDSRKETSYSFTRRFRALIDSIASFSEKPLYGVFFLGFGMFIFSILVAIYLIGLKVTGSSLPGWISVMVSLWGLSGLILLSIGIVGIYISRIFIETKNRPFTIIRKIHAGERQS